MESSKHIFYPDSVNELLNDVDRNPDATLFSGGASWMQKQTGELFFLPTPLVSLYGIAELRRITRTERYLEIGAMVSLSRIAGLGKIVPEALVLSLRSTQSLLLRNITTIGGCICRRSTPEPVIAGLVALDARYELRRAASSRWVSAAQFSSPPEKDGGFQAKECLARLRVPLETWNYTLCRDFSAKESGDTGNGFAVFLARIQKDFLSEVRVIFSGATILRDRDSELTLINKKLPLDKKTIANFLDLWREYLSPIGDRSEFQKAKLLNFVDSAIHYFAY
ncbi:MAG: FAD binding domain-containing protein [Spirochaetaceae bacterium]|jgi:CO/xanthine dehydrogenase FAD-binding subunit|nr:FAD binding domain-containing protein [Spirochaetaceae bacterium]